LDLGVEIDDLARDLPERADVNALFDKLEFGPQARDRFLSAFLPQGAPEPVSTTELEQATVVRPGEVSDWLAAHAPAGGRHGLVTVCASPAAGSDDPTT